MAVMDVTAGARKSKLFFKGKSLCVQWNVTLQRLIIFTAKVFFTLHLTIVSFHEPFNVHFEERRILDEICPLSSNMLH